jgi:Raf kinase inhibitor-like YbhB/YbcL family protein
VTSIFSRDTGGMRRLLLLAAAALLASCGGGDEADEPLPQAGAKLQLESPAFQQGADIPTKFSCDGADVSPALSWRSVPSGTRELALVMEDRDADGFVHWTVLGIAPRTTRVREGRIPTGAVETENSFGDRGWGGPCPPEGDEPHRYVFALYALKRELGLGGGASPDEVREGLAAAGLARGTLTGRFGR